MLYNGRRSGTEEIASSVVGRSHSRNLAQFPLEIASEFHYYDPSKRLRDLGP